MTRTLKINRKYTVIQTDNQITGDTYPCKDWIKTYCDGKWDASTKSWIINQNKVNEWISKGVISIISATKITEVTPKIDSGWCNHCHSYCYGDCQS